MLAASHTLTCANSNDDLELNAYNAAFHELGFRWHWDPSTYRALFSCNAPAGECVQRYLATQQPHLLRAYDAAFLVQVIEDKKASHAARIAASNGCRQHFDWAQSLGCELGA